MYTGQSKYSHIVGEQKKRSGGTCLSFAHGENNSPEDVSFLMDARMEQFIWKTRTHEGKKDHQR